MMRPKFLIPLVAMSLAAGCIKPPVEARLDPYQPSQVEISDPDLRSHTTVGTPTAQRDREGNILYVTVPIRAATDRQLHVDYRVKFFDKGGQVLSETGWYARTLAPNVFDYITVSAGTAPRAADFQMDFRYSR
jgi:hypothetical protein